ncbi:MAG: hypothetical protein AAF670_17540 [Planctomycetota bacterium]
MNEDAIVRRRHLPHIDVEGHPFFVTACLAGSLPAMGLKQIRAYREQLEEKPLPNGMSLADWEIKKHKLVFKRTDELLDHRSPVTHLADDRLAEIVQNAFLHFSGARYKLLAFVVMPSHHHWLFLPDPAWAMSLVDRPGAPRTPREAISHSIQSYTATQCNRALGRAGVFWQDETYDHYARDEAEVHRIIHYIEHNPVRAGLVQDATSYRWSSARLRSEQGLAPGEPIVG